jgi:hypothetical protein
MTERLVPGGLSTGFPSGGFSVDAPTVKNSAFFCSQTLNALEPARFPIGHETPAAFSPQYPSGFFAKYCLSVVGQSGTDLRN